MLERRFGFVGNTGFERVGRDEDGDSTSTAEKDRFLLGERKEFGDRLGRRWVGDG